MRGKSDIKGGNWRGDKELVRHDVASNVALPGVPRLGTKRGPKAGNKGWEQRGFVLLYRWREIELY